MEIKKGKQNTPIRAVAYGPEGIGKSTFAAAWPAPLFIDAEGGTARLNVDRVHPLSWSAVCQAVDELSKNSQGYKTLVLDTADWLEKLLAEDVCAAANMKSIEAFGYGKGYTHVAEAWKRFLDKLNAMQGATGMHVLFLAHAAMRKFEQPDEAGAYDRWELKLMKQSPAILKEWADLVLFLNYKTLVVENENGKAKAQGGRRVMFSTHHPCWDAKNRFCLAEELPLEFAAISGIFAAAPVQPVQPVQQPAAQPATKPQPAAPVKADNAEEELSPVPGAAAPAPAATLPEVSSEKAALLGQLAQLMRGSGITKEELGAELARKGVVPADMNPREYNEATLKRVVAGWKAVTNNINLQKQKAA